MPRFAANVSLMYTEYDFLDRFAAAAADGFRAVEFLFAYEHDPREIASRLQDLGLAQALFNAPPGDYAAGERGLASLPGQQDSFRRALLEQALPWARALGCQRVHVMAGLVPPDADHAAHRATYVDNLAWAAEQAAAEGVRLLIEPINQRDVPGYFINRQADAHAIVAEVGAPNLQVQMDLYHCQIVEGDLATKLRCYLGPGADGGRVGHLQIAGVPTRHEPDIGELHYPYLFALIDELGYHGHVGCEYRPRGATSAGLGWFAAWRDQQG